MGSQIKDRVYTLAEAVALISELSALLVLLTAAIWLFTQVVGRESTRSARTIIATLGTIVILSLYGLTVITWRQHWTVEKGLTESAQFMPLLGHVNAQFFVDFGWLTYFLYVVPPVSILSGLIMWLFYCFEYPRKESPG